MKNVISYQAAGIQSFNIKVEEGNRVKLKSEFEDLSTTDTMSRVDSNNRVTHIVRNENPLVMDVDKVTDDGPSLMVVPEAKESTGFMSKLRNLFK